MTYDIPMEYDSFFTPVGKKENLAFVDFCSLFKPNMQKELFMKTFSKSFNIVDQKKNENAFPITITKRI